MKILQVIAGAEHGGAEIFFERLVGALHKAGVTQHVVMRDHLDRRLGLDSHHIPYTVTRFSRVLATRSRRVLKHVLNTFMPDIVLTWMSRASAICPKGDYISVARLGGYYDLKYYKNADYLIGNTQDIVDYFHAHHWDPRFTQYLPNFVPKPTSSEKQDRSVYNTPQDAPLLLSLGRFHDDKAFDILIPALKNLKGVYLWLGGDGERHHALQALAHQCNVSDRVRFVGWHHDVTPLFNAADVYVCPSRIEPLGNVIIEAWAHKCPIVAAKSLGPKGLITHGENGLLTEIDSIEGLSQNIQHVLENDRLRQDLIHQGYHTFETLFSEEKIVKDYINFFEKILHHKKEKSCVA